MTIIDKSSNTTLLFAGYDETSQETIVKAEITAKEQGCLVYDEARLTIVCEWNDTWR